MDALEQVARRSYGKLVAFLAARTGDLAAAEDALSDAVAAALTDWRTHGAPANPEAWLLTVARRRAIDAARRRRTAERGSDLVRLLVHEAEADGEPSVPDRRLALLFACAHPAIDGDIRAPLMLQAVLGLDAGRIASAFLVSPAAMAQRLVRAKAKIRQARIPFSLPERDELPGRLEAVLDAVYAAFAEGWTDPAGTDLMRRDLIGESLFLARLVVELLPGEPEALGLLSLMLHAEARRRTRRSADGEYVPLEEQDPAAWDSAMIEEAEALLRQAGSRGSIGRYQLEAAIQSAHAERRRTGKANWDAVERLYAALSHLSGSPVVALNRALAIAELRGARAALQSLEPLAGNRRLAAYQPYWAVRAELLARAGDRDDANRAYEMAIGLERDAAVRRWLQRRQSALVSRIAPVPESGSAPAGTGGSRSSSSGASRDGI